MSKGKKLGKRQRLKELSLNIVVMSLGVLLSLLAAELLSRIFVPIYLVKPHPKGLYVNDPDLGYILSKNFYARHQHPDYDVIIDTNSDGFRGGEITAKRPDTFRILVLGDSIAWGYGVGFEDSFPRQLEEMLNENLDANFEVINAAVPGYGTDQELDLLKKLGLDYQLDLIIVGLFVENDVYDNLVEGAKHRTVRGGYLIDQYRYERNVKENPLVIVTAFLSKNSHFYVFLRSYFRSFMANIGKVSVEFHPESFPGFAQPDYLPVFAKEYSSEMKRGMSITEQLLKEIVGVGKAHQASTLVVLFPSKAQVYPDLWNDIQRIYHLDDHAYSLTKPNEILLDFGLQNDILFLDLLPAFREANPNASLYFRTDLHQSATGQALAAQKVYEGLLAQNLVPRR